MFTIYIQLCYIGLTHSFTHPLTHPLIHLLTYLSVAHCDSLFYFYQLQSQRVFLEAGGDLMRTAGESTSAVGVVNMSILLCP